MRRRFIKHPHEKGMTIVAAVMLGLIIAIAIGYISNFFIRSNQNARRISETQDLTEVYHQLAASFKDKDLLKRGFDPLIDLQYLFPGLPQELLKGNLFLQSCAKRDHHVCQRAAFENKVFDFIMIRPQTFFVEQKKRDESYPITGTKDQPVLYQADGKPCLYPGSTPSEQCPFKAWTSFRLLCPPDQPQCNFPGAVHFFLFFTNAEVNKQKIDKALLENRVVQVPHISYADEIIIPLTSPRILVTVAQIGGEIQNCLKLRITQNRKDNTYLLCGYPLSCEEKCNHIQDERLLAKNTPHQWIIPVEPGACQLFFEFISLVPAKIRGQFFPCHQRSPSSSEECKHNPDAYCYGNNRPCGAYSYVPIQNSVEKPFASIQKFMSPIPKSSFNLGSLELNNPIPDAQFGSESNQKLHIHKVTLENNRKQFFLAFEDGSFWPNSQEGIDLQFQDYVVVVEGDIAHCHSNLDPINNTGDLIIK